MIEIGPNLSEALQALAVTLTVCAMWWGLTR